MIWGILIGFLIGVSVSLLLMAAGASDMATARMDSDEPWEHRR
jgi:hypothetical protein